jgi:predicted MPP superfamily phosphohydrolase
LGRFDLQLSGHAHRGQIFPFNLLTGLHYPQQDGLYALAQGAWLYASRGTGTWGPPMRLFAPPEITLFIIERSPSP